MIGLRRPLAVLATRLPPATIEAAMAASPGAVGSVALQSTAGLVTQDGTQIKSGASIAVQGLGVALLARKDLSKPTATAGATTAAPTTENLVQTRLLAEGDFALLASGSGTDQGN